MAIWQQDLPLQKLLLRLRELREDGIYFAAIRHHSPRCAKHLIQWLDSIKPVAVLIEGPSRADSLLGQIKHPQAKPPLAIYRYHPNYSGSWFYPLCDYSPEWQAMRYSPCPVHFIDLDDRKPHDVNHQAINLLNDAYLSHSQYLQALARSAHCANTDDLWDALFELRQFSDSTQFFDEVAAYCSLGRRDYSDDALTADATLAREQQMASWINHYRNQYGTPLVIVVGGFHAAALPFNLEKTSAPQPTDADYRYHLIRYSFSQLDRLQGYSAGMPNPNYYQKAWEHKALRDATRDILIDIAKASRSEKLPRLISTADITAAMFQAEQLALIRGHPEPGRTELLDAVRSVFIKGEDERFIINAIVSDQLRGDRIGSLPPGIESPPLLVDFNQKISHLKLPLTSEKRRIHLEPRRKALHRSISALMHCFDLLRIGYSRRVDGGGLNARRIHETWECQWSPHVDSRLIELAFLGDSLEAAAIKTLCQNHEELAKDGLNRCCRAQVELLVCGYRCGLETTTRELQPSVISAASEDTDISSLADALILLENLSDDALVLLKQVLWSRICYLLPEWEHCSEAQQETALKTLILLHSAGANRSDGDLFRDALCHLADHAPALLKGGAMGLCWAEGILDDASFTAKIRPWMTVSAKHSQVSMLRGLFTAAKGILLQVPTLIMAIHQEFLEWDEETFLQLLPEMRLAMATYTPREIDRISEKIAEICGFVVTPDINYHLDESALGHHLRLSQALAEQLKTDGLSHWLSAVV